MEQRIIEEISFKRKISIDAVIREYYEYMFLRDFFESPAGGSVAFKGGTALRVFYGLPRYSDNLDFTVIKKLDFSLFSEAVKTLSAKYTNTRITDLWDKKNTSLCEIKITEDWLKMPFSIKFEISKRDIPAGRGIELKMAQSQDFGIQVLGNVFTLEAIYADKLLALKGRDEPKDYFDLWYICQLKKIPFNPGKKPDAKRYRQVLGRYLPASYMKILDQIL
jgi:predicted nucleotidyltransferase component of viral defense system